MRREFSRPVLRAPGGETRRGTDAFILSRGHAEEALVWSWQVMARLGLALNEAKTSIRNAQQERFDFLGCGVGLHRYRKDGHRYLGACPSDSLYVRIPTMPPGHTEAEASTCF